MSNQTNLARSFVAKIGFLPISPSGMNNMLWSRRPLNPNFVLRLQSDSVVGEHEQIYLTMNTNIN
jgi:hypothetical protein